jgi:hypothetical protein
MQTDSRLRNVSARTTVVAAAASAVGLWAAMPPLDLGALAWVALVPVALVSLASEGRNARFAVPLAFALFLELVLVWALPPGLADGQWGEPPVPLLIGGSPVLPVAMVAVPLFGALLYTLRFPQPIGAQALQRVGLPWAPLFALLVPARPRSTSSACASTRVGFGALCSSPSTMALPPRLPRSAARGS